MATIFGDVQYTQVMGHLNTFNNPGPRWPKMAQDGPRLIDADPILHIFISQTIQRHLASVEDLFQGALANRVLKLWEWRIACIAL